MDMLPMEIVGKILLYLRHPVAQLMVNKYKLMKAPLFTTLTYYQYISKLPRIIYIDYCKIYSKEKYRYGFDFFTESDSEED